MPFLEMKERRVCNKLSIKDKGSRMSIVGRLETYGIKNEEQPSMYRPHVDAVTLTM